MTSKDSALYDDLTLRASLADHGDRVRTPPSSVPDQSWLDVSPDIVCSGTVPLVGPSTLLTLPAAIDLYLGSAPTMVARNFVYVRAWNLSNRPVDGEVFLYATPASLTLWSDVWATNGLTTSSGARSLRFSQVAGKSYAASCDPFISTPMHHNGFADHALVGRVVTLRHPNPLPAKMENVDQLIEYQINAPGFVATNMRVVPSTIDSFNVPIAFEWRGPSHKLRFFIVVRNAPPETMLMVRNFPTQPFDSPLPDLYTARRDVGGNAVTLPLLTEPPDGWSGYLLMTVWPGISPLPADCTFSVWACLELDGEVPPHQAAARIDPRQLGATAEALDDPGHSKQWVCFGMHETRVVPA
jgi:hypothetical protein